MFKLYDWKCQTCGSVQEVMIDVKRGDSAPRLKALLCDTCGKSVLHDRLFPLPARYLADRPLNPTVFGGEFDTMGYKRLPALPEFKGESAKELRDFVNTSEYREAKREREARKSENRAKKKRAALLQRGQSINMRVDKLPGDPKVAS